jgi:hypothetical protein
LLLLLQYGFLLTCLGQGTFVVVIVEWFSPLISSNTKCAVCKVRDELEQLLDDDDDMADLYLSRKLAGASSPVSGSGGPNWFPSSPTLVSKLSRASRASAATMHGNENDVEELEMLLEVVMFSFLPERQ